MITSALAMLLALDLAVVEAARVRTRSSVIYDGAYRRLDYPGGDVPLSIGVCTDLVIRAYRTQGIDLQQLVHEDMRRDFAAYPDHWGLAAPDRNIDHRRVPNLETFFARHGTRLPVSQRASDYRPGDLVTWRLDGRLPHIGIVSDRTVPGTDRPLVLHNVGAGPKEEDRLFAYPIVGHFRFAPGNPP